MVQGRGSDNATIKKAENFGTILINEDGFYKLVAKAMPPKSQVSTISSSPSPSLSKGKGKATASVVANKEM